MAKPRRENDARRVVKIYRGGENWGINKGDYKLSDNSVLSSYDDETAQENFKKSGFNKGKAGDMAKNLSSRVEKSIPDSSPASKNYDGAPQGFWGEVPDPKKMGDPGYGR